MFIIIGVSGSGKTSLGKHLSLMTSMPFYDADDFHSKANKNKMRSGNALNDLDRQPWLNELSEKITQWSLSGGAILACSALKEAYRQTLSKNNNNIIWVVLNGSFDLIESRLKKRKNHFFDSQLLQSQLYTLELPNYGIHLEINESVEVLSQSVLNKKIIKGIATIGVIGLGPMGQGIALNCSENGFETAVFNRFVEGEKSVVFDFLSANTQFRNLYGFTNIVSFIHALDRPRKIWLMIKSGDAIDTLLKEIVPLLDQGDIIIDGGNSYYQDTQRREKELKKRKIYYIGCGVSGGELGARHGASFMFGGSKVAYRTLTPILKSIAAKDKADMPCQIYLGTGGAGHFVKMVHNGIEYAEMQLIAEIYAVLSHQMGHSQIASLFRKWNEGSQESYLLEISSKIIQKKEGSNYLVDMILDNAGSKGTGMWSTQTSLILGEVNTMMSSALFARYLSNMKNRRALLAPHKPKPQKLKTFELLKLRKAYKFARIINHVQGFNLIESASKKYNWNYKPAEIARAWTAGCIIRSHLMENLIEYFSVEKTLFKNKTLIGNLTKSEPYMAALLHHAIDQKIALDSFSSAYQYWIALCTENLPTNLIQAQRNFFGTHTYQRVDKPKGKLFNTKWY